MNQEQEFPSQLPAAPFPAPPPFWKYFTTENAARLEAIESEPSTKDGALPIELACLKPPQPPSSNAQSYSVFSIPQSLNPNPALPPSEILLFEPNSPSFNPSEVLTKLTKSLLVNFLELTTYLGNNPMQYADKMGDINRLMLNIHCVINMYRPHQAREGVKEMLQAKLEDGQREIEYCDQMKTRVNEFLASLQSQGTDPLVDPSNITQEKVASDKGKTTDPSVKENRDLWRLINEIDDDN